MKKTLYCEKERKSNLEIPSYIKVTATKVAEIEAGKINEYADDKGNRYIVQYNKFLRREEFTKIN